MTEEDAGYIIIKVPTSNVGKGQKTSPKESKTSPQKSTIKTEPKKPKKQELYTEDGRINLSVVYEKSSSLLDSFFKKKKPKEVGNDGITG